MDNKNRKKTNSIGGAAVVVIAILATLVQGIGDSEALIVIFVVLAILAVFAAAIYVVVKKRIAEAKEIKNPFTHSHDRLDRMATGDNCDVDAHWKVQLDGFLKAGIIDKKEYGVLMNRHSRQYMNYPR